MARERELSAAAQAAMRAIAAGDALRTELMTLSEVVDSGALDEGVEKVKARMASAAKDATLAGGQAFLGVMLGALSEMATEVVDESER